MAGTPAHRYLHYRLNHNSGGSKDSHYFDLFRDLSRLNQRLYKQGQVLSIKSVSAFNTSGTTVLKICTAPDTWMTRQAWKRAERIHSKQFEDALEAQGGNSKLPSYHDFKVFLNQSMMDDPDFVMNTISDHNLNNVLSVDSSGLPCAEWDYADYETDMSGITSFKTGLLGGNSANYVGIIQSYGETRLARTNEGTMDQDFADDPLAAALTFGTSEDMQEEILENIQYDNNNAPYATVPAPDMVGESYVGASGNMPSSQLVRMCAVGGASNPDVAITRGFDAICGLVEIETTSSVSDDAIDVIFEISIGDYKGVKTHAI